MFRIQEINTINSGIQYFVMQDKPTAASEFVAHCRTKEDAELFVRAKESKMSHDAQAKDTTAIRGIAEFDPKGWYMSAVNDPANMPIADVDIVDAVAFSKIEPPLPFQKTEEVEPDPIPEFFKAGPG